MSITTLDAALAGMKTPQFFVKGVTGTLVVGRATSSLYLPGIPPAGAVPSPGIGGANLVSYAGCFTYPNPTPPAVSYLARFAGLSSAASGILMLCDRLWHNSGIDVTSVVEQVFTAAPQIPARDDAGANAGVGVLAGIEVTSATGAGTPTLTFKYTNSSGVQNQVGTNIVATVASSIQGTFYQIALAAGDRGIQVPQSLTLSATWTGGTLSAVLYRPIATLELAAGIPNAIDVLTGGLPRLNDNSTLFFLWIPGATTSTNLYGQLIWAQG